MNVFLSVPPPSQMQTMMPDLGIGYIATGLRKSDHTVDVYQGEKDTGFDRFRESLRAANPGLIGLKVYSMEVHAAQQAIKISRELYPDTPIVLGGPHISVIPAEDVMISFPGADYAIQGEAEISLPLLADLLDGKRVAHEDIPGLVYRENGVNKHNSPLYHMNIDDFGIPAWDILDPRNYTDRWFFWNPAQVGAPMLTSRGCPYRCAFCAQNVVGGKRVRRRKLESVLEEIELLMRDYGIMDFEFLDDNFLMDIQYVTDLCNAFLDRGLKITWSCGGARLEKMDINLVKLMEKAGCQIISVGIESGSQAMLNYMQKDTTLEMLREKIGMISKYTSIRVMGMFIIGYPTETVEDIRKTIRFSLKLPIFVATYFTYILFPGCLEYERLKASGELADIPWETLNVDAHNYAPRGMSFSTLNKLYKEAYFRFYSRPKVLWRILRYSGRRLPLIIKNGLRKWKF